ncbi:phosphonate ABC transporter, permease protein PhnE [Caldovatus aquaticus]|uniref:Phosphonate ABC transporter, permease protein PhnE n=1 Tax=Caldovatus aquaticus TaxID=2865671 RepID=A0ABS7F1M5_9PROT|nr:phosphonate ABC transporter, permease protein PhnE [Caldovatus aquaticus]MBW8269459.1 phosphonate ABC transporter, permease protein PhnE [Caldovatus aquaticus]
MTGLTTATGGADAAARGATGPAARSGPVRPLLREWSRFTPRQRLARWLVWLGVVAAVAWAVRSIDIIPEFLADAPAQMADLLVRMWPPDLGHYYPQVHTALVETLHIATLGTLLAFALAVPVALLAARNICRVAPLNWLAQLVLVASRSVNSLVWALIFVAVFGPGATAGVFAIAFRSIGFVGKLLAEALEEVAPGPVEAVRATGAGWGATMLKAVWPQVQPAFWGIALFRWDINVRESAVLGLVGAGGIGVVLNDAIDFFQWDRVATVLLAILGVVLVAEVLVNRIRARLI